jgi:hypothetical protein
METECSLPCSQNPVTGTYLNPRNLVLSFIEIPYNIIP